MAIVTIRRHGVTWGCPGPGSKPGIKTDVQGWSESSTRSNLQFLRGIEEDQLTGHGYAVTLTVRECPESEKDWASMRNCWLKRLRRAGLIRCHWVTEWQRRGVPHLHGSVYMPDEDPGQFVDAWLSVAGKFGARSSGQYVTPIWDQVGFSKYVAKHAARGLSHYQRSPANIPQGWKKTGRMWGKVGSWPEGSSFKLSLTPAASYRFRRLVKRYRIANARADRFDVRARRIRAARRMLRGTLESSLVRGLSEWIPQEVTFRLMAAAAAVDEVDQV